MPIKYSIKYPINCIRRYFHTLRIEACYADNQLALYIGELYVGHQFREPDVKASLFSSPDDLEVEDEDFLSDSSFIV